MSGQRLSSGRAQQGFTLVELVVGIVITAVVAGFIAAFLGTPVQAYLAQERRTTLSEQARLSMQWLEDDLRVAVPNSVRFAQSGTRLAIELWPVIDVARYRTAGSLGLPAHELALPGSDDQFSLYAGFTRITYPLVSNTHRLVIHNTGQPGSNVYQQTNVITPAGMTLRIDDNNSDAIPGLPADEDHVTLGSAFGFSSPSPTQSVYLVEGPVRYLCDASAHTLRRYTGYTVTAALTPNAPASGMSSLISNVVGACSIGCIAGSAQCGRTISLNLSFTRDGESLNLLQQVSLQYSE